MRSLSIAFVMTGAAWAQELALDVPPPPRPAGVMERLRQEEERLRPKELELPSLEPFAPPLDLSNVGYGPLRVGTGSPFHSVRLDLLPEAPSTLRSGQWEVRENLTWSRIWAQSDDYLLSFETLGQVNSVAYGISDRFQMELGAVATARFTGELERFVRDFHDTFNIPQGGRDSVDLGSYHFRLGDVEIDRSDETVDHVFASFRYMITPGGDFMPAISATLTLSSGVGNSEVQGDSLSVAGMLSAAKGFGDFYAYAAAGFAWFGDLAFHGLALRPFGASVMAGLEWRILTGVSLVAQHLWSPGAIEGFEELSRPAFELALGLKIEAVRGSILELAMTENILEFDSSPDFGLHAGLVVRF
jgi:hypothetical protein